MKYRAGFLTVLCSWMVILMMQSLDAGHAPKKPACQLKDLTALAKSLVEKSLEGYDKANGGDIGTWSAGFPDLQVNDDSPLNWSKVQCSLHFMVQGLEKVLEDQKNNLNPTDVSLHEMLRTTISKVKNVASCAKNNKGGECSPTPSPPEMPSHAFEKKQWSRTLLKTAGDYLEWLQRKLVVHISKVKGKNNKIKGDSHKATLQKYLEGSGYLL